MDAKAKVARYMFWPHGASWLDGVSQSGGGEMEINAAGDYVLHSDHELALVELNKEHESTLSRFITGTIEDTLTIDQLTAERERLLTDHEAALAELREELQKQKSLNAGYQSTIAMIEVKLTTLLTGLEALAGVVDVIRLNSDYADAYMVNENIPAEARLRRARQVDQAIEKIENVRTLASAGLEGK